MSKVSTDCRYTELGRIRVTLSITYSTHPPNDEWDKTTLKIVNDYKSHHAKELFVVSNHPHTRMFCQHVCSHLSSMGLLQNHLLLTVHPVADKVVFCQDLLGASMVDWVVDKVQSRLTIHVDADKGRDCISSFHLKLELAKKAGLLSCHSEGHVLAFAGADGCSSGHEDKTSARATRVGTGKVARIAVSPQLC